MSLSGALSNALSGLTANARAASVVSSNISNAQTDGYGRRELAISTSTLSAGGVRVDGVRRHVNPVVLGDRRLSDAETAMSKTLQDFAVRMELLAGEPTDSGSLSGRMAAFENALITAASNPASAQRLNSVSAAAEDLAATFNGLSAGLQNARQDADRAIHFQVDKLNETLAQVEKLNNRIMSAARLGRDASSLMDQRQKAIDTIAEAIPLRSVARDNGGVALFSTGGVALLDGRAATLAFAPTPIILPHMTQENGLLSGLSINGKSVNMSVNGPMSGGSLGARFQIRDQETVLLQAQLDGVARDVIERLGPGGPDSSIAVSDPGLFMDAGSAFLATEEIGISGRITLNPLAARDGGETWRLRDGLGVAGPGEVGQAGLLNALYATLTDAVLPSSASLAPTSQSVAERASDWSSAIGAFRVRQDAQLSFAQAQNVALSELVLAEGVDSDQELQFLILLEQSFQANAKVMTTVDDMIQTVLAI